MHDLMNEVINPVQHPNPLDKTDKKVTVPTGVVSTPETRTVQNGPLAPTTFAERDFNIQRWTDMPRGGHFAAI